MRFFCISSVLFRVFCQQYICPAWSRGCTRNSVPTIPRDNCKHPRYFFFFFLPFMFPVVGSAAHPLSHCSRRSLLFIRPWTAADEDEQEIAHVTHSAVHFPGMIRAATVASSAQREGQTGACPLHSDTRDNKGRATLLCAFPALGSFTGMHAWQQPASGRYTKHGNPRKTNGLSSNNLKWGGINIKANAWMFFASGIWKRRRERAISLCSEIVPGVDCKAVRAAR